MRSVHRTALPLLLLLAAPAWGQKEAVSDLVSVEKGDLPIILSAPHGGTLDIPGVAARTGEGLAKGASGFFAGRDPGVEELAHQTSDAIFAKAGKRPYLVVARFHRKYLDANRPPDIGAEDPPAKAVYDAYHGALQRFCADVRTRFGGGLLIDIHGQGTSRTTVYRGTHNGATVTLLRQRFGAEYVNGPKSLLGLLQARGWKVHPADDGKEQSGFTGGYIVRSTGTPENGIDAIQLEFGGDYRSASGRPATAAVLADALLEFTRLYTDPAARKSAALQFADPAAVREVMEGRRKTADARWWGFDPEDATDAIRAAIRSGASKVVIPNVGQPWIVRPIQLASNQELQLEPGVEIVAKRGEYRGKGDCVFTGAGLRNVTISGKGATVRMQKEDYIVGGVLKDYFNWNRWYGQYEKAEWRCTLRIDGCSHVRVSGLALKDSGGDGIYIGGQGREPCRDIAIRDVVCDNHYRQGMSIISVDGLKVEKCTFSNTWGTPPSSGVDIEPDTPDECIRGVEFRGCKLVDNYGDGIEVFLANLKRSSGPVSIRFEDCTVSSRRGAGLRVAKVMDDGPEGLVEFVGCTVEHTEGYGLKVRDKSADGVQVRFANCTVLDAARDRQYADTWAPIVLDATASARVTRYGGVEFAGCTLDDRRDRPSIVTRLPSAPKDVRGTIRLVGRPPQDAVLGTLPELKVVTK